MELFSEVYGLYYRLVSDILQQDEMSRTEIMNFIESNGFAETFYIIESKLLSDDGYGLLKQEDQKYNSTLHHDIRRSLTLLEKRWLKAILNDPKVSLFIDQQRISELQNALREIEPLYNPHIFHNYDHFSDGDPIDQEPFQVFFKQLLNAIKSKTALTISYQGTKRRTPSVLTFSPHKIEFSLRDNKFRVHGLSNTGVFTTLNIARILTINSTNDTYLENYQMLQHLLNQRIEEPLVIKISQERNSLERFMFEFSTFEKVSEMDEESNICTVNLWYPKQDESEILIRLLAYGPTIKVVSPPLFIQLIRDRVQKQAQLFTADYDSNS